MLRFCKALSTNLLKLSPTDFFTGPQRRRRRSTNLKWDSIFQVCLFSVFFLPAAPRRDEGQPARRLMRTQPAGFPTRPRTVLIHHSCRHDKTRKASFAILPASSHGDSLDACRPLKINSTKNPEPD
jgi:hypothetical protein